MTGTSALFKLCHFVTKVLGRQKPPLPKLQSLYGFRFRCGWIAFDTGRTEIGWRQCARPLDSQLQQVLALEDSLVLDPECVRITVADQR